MSTKPMVRAGVGRATMMASGFQGGSQGNTEPTAKTPLPSLLREPASVILRRCCRELATVHLNLSICASRSSSKK